MQSIEMSDNIQQNKLTLIKLILIKTARFVLFLHSDTPFTSGLRPRTALERRVKQLIAKSFNTFHSSANRFNAKPLLHSSVITRQSSPSSPSWFTSIPLHSAVTPKSTFVVVTLQDKPSSKSQATDPSADKMSAITSESDEPLYVSDEIESKNADVIIPQFDSARSLNQTQHLNRNLSFLMFPTEKNDSWSSGVASLTPLEQSQPTSGRSSLPVSLTSSATTFTDGRSTHSTTKTEPNTNKSSENTLRFSHQTLVKFNIDSDFWPNQTQSAFLTSSNQSTSPISSKSINRTVPVDRITLQTNDDDESLMNSVQSNLTADNLFARIKSDISSGQSDSSPDNDDADDEEGGGRNATKSFDRPPSPLNRQNSKWWTSLELPNDAKQK
jgi:hypothetical protein